MAYGDKGGASREGEVLAMLEAWPPDAMWCEAEESAQAPRVTRQQARLEAVEKLQDAWRRLKRDEKSMDRVMKKVQHESGQLQAEAVLLGDDSPFLQGPPQLQGLLRDKNPFQEQRRRTQAHQAALSPEPEQPNRMTRQRSTSSAPLSPSSRPRRASRSASAATAPADKGDLSVSAGPAASRTGQGGASGAGGAHAGALAAGHPT